MVLLFKDTFTVFDPVKETILTGWRELHGARLWRFLLSPEVDELLPSPLSDAITTLGTFSAYDLTIIEALVRYFHASSGFQVNLTWITDIKEGNYWRGPSQYVPFDIILCYVPTTIYLT